MSQRPKVLIIEDYPALQNAYLPYLEEKLEVLQAYSIEEARILFEHNKQFIELISFDGRMGDDITTIELIKEIKAQFTDRPMLAVSQEKFLRNKQMEAGCTHEVTEKALVPEKILELLKL